MSNGKRSFAVLDRDGTIIYERNYLSSPENVELLPGASVGLRRLQEMGFGLVVVTNQSGIGRGYFGEAELQLIHARMQSLLERDGVRLDGIYVCPHMPEAACTCRKPRPGLVERAAQELQFDPVDSVFIGDKQCDIELGRSLGGTTVLVKTGYGAQHLEEGLAEPDLVAESLDEAASLVAARLTGPTWKRGS